jgi:hypothetical protein
VTEAVFGFVGVLVGSAITWGIELWRARRTDVADELESIENARTAAEPQFRRQRDLALQQDAWLKHRVVLARELTDEHWRAVRAAYDALAVGGQGSRGTEQWIRSCSREAMRALAPLMSSRRRYWWQRLRSRLGSRRGREEQRS